LSLIDKQLDSSNKKLVGFTYFLFVLTTNYIFFGANVYTSRQCLLWKPN